MRRSAWAAVAVLVGLAHASITLAQANRAVVLAALERLRTTGQPVHTNHDEGELLQRAGANGVSIDFTAGFADTPTMKRHFVLDIPAGERAQVQVQVVYPPGYGWVTVQASQTDHVVVPSVEAETTWLDGFAWRAVNPQLAPPGFAKWVGHVVCANQCRGF